MQTRKIGSLEVSVVALGCHDLGNELPEDTSIEVVNAALDAGIRLFDTAEGYGKGVSEQTLGKALGSRRDEAIVGTKYNGRPETAREHVEASLKRLNMDHIDLLTHHHPEPGVPLAETLGALSALKDDGLIREFGVSNLTFEQLQEAVAASTDSHRFVSLQNDYNLMNRKMEFEVLPECVASGVAFTCYFPLYHGLLTGKFSRNEIPDPSTRLGQDSDRRKAIVMTSEHFDIVEGLQALSEKSGHPVLHLSLARLLAQPGVTAVLPGAWSVEQVKENAAAGSVVLTAEEIAEIDRVAPSDPNSPPTPSSMNGN